MSLQSETTKRDQARIDLVQNDHYTARMGRIVTQGEVRRLAEQFNRANKTAKFVKDCPKVPTGKRGGGMKKACYVPGTPQAGRLAMLERLREDHIVKGLTK